MLFKPTYLYVKTQIATGLKYFGKSVKESEKEVHKYQGSGLVWNRYLNKYGKEYTTEIIGYFTDKEECEFFALKFSKENNIVESKEWANLLPENGLNGGPLPGKANGMFGKHMSKESREKISKASIKMWKKDGYKKAHSIKMTGEGNPMFGQNDQCYGLIKHGEFRTGKTYEEIFGKEKSLEIKNNLSRSQKGKIHNLKELICPFCSLKGKGPNMIRYHFDNCLLNPDNPDNIIGKSSSIVKEDLRKKEYVCPHCGKRGMNIGNMKRWHFDNCKYKG